MVRRLPPRVKGANSNNKANIINKIKKHAKSILKKEVIKDALKLSELENQISNSNNSNSNNNRTGNNIRILLNAPILRTYKLAANTATNVAKNNKPNKPSKLSGLTNDELKILLDHITLAATTKNGGTLKEQMRNVSSVLK